MRTGNTSFGRVRGAMSAHETGKQDRVVQSLVHQQPFHLRHPPPFPMIAQHTERKEEQQRSSPTSLPIHLPPSPDSLEQRSPEVDSILRIFRGLQNGKRSVSLVPWTEYRLTELQIEELEQDVERDDELKAWYHDKARVDIDRRRGRCVIRMPTDIHECIITTINRRIIRTLEIIVQDDTIPAAVRELAGTVQCRGSSDVELGSSKRTPDSSFGPYEARLPGLIVEVAYSQPGKNLKRLVKEYFGASGGLVHTVVCVQVDYRGIDATTASVWRASWKDGDDNPRVLHLDEDLVWENDEATNEIKLRLSDFFSLDDAASLQEVNPPIPIPFSLIQGEIRALKEALITRADRPLPRSDYVVEGASSSSSADELRSSDELAFVDRENIVEERQDRMDLDYVNQ
ncbi:MAG: hypothetical protein M1823_000867 [Watsoniomyces obsoletus]|nr:MAG: hypothetical protein M1823_000867 [Watsoniomyces obsoletus]